MKKLMLMVVVCVFLFSGIAHAVPVQWTTASGGNGNWYEFIDPGQYIPWNTAREGAESSSWLGMTGYLVTTTSSAENAFVIQAFLTNAPVSWIFNGAFQPEGTQEPTGGWTWVTGEIWSYTNWRPSEPNDNPLLGGEDVIQVFTNLSDFAPGSWNDLHDNIPGYPRGGYIIEYGSTGGVGGGGGSAPVPEPATMLLLGSGLVGLAGFRRKFRKK